MATDDQQVLVTGVASAPATFRIPGNGQITPRAIFAHYDGSGAAGTYVPALKITSDGGELVGIYPLRSTTLAAGVSADISWFPEVDDAPQQASEVTGLTSETVFYDTVNAGTPLTMATTLEANTPYVLIVEGTFTLWNTALGEGTPEPDAQFPGSVAGRVSTQVGLDADTCFARQTGSARPLGHSDILGFSLDGGGTFTHIEPVGGPYATPLTGHLYRYNLTGQGFPLHIKLTDIHPPDNYGKLRITLQVPSGTGTGSGAGSLVPPADTTLNNDVLTVVSGLPAWATPAAGGVSSVTAADTSIVVGGTAANPTVRTGTLDVVAADHPAAANWSNNSKKITALTAGAAAGEAAIWDQTDSGIVTAKGDLVVATGSHAVARLGVGADTNVLTADSAQASGVKWSAAGSGTISDITSTGGTITVGSPTGPTTNVDLPTSGAAAGTYGDANHTAQVTVNNKGIVTAAAQIAISGLAGTGLNKLVSITRATTGALDTGANAIPTGHGSLLVLIWARSAAAATTEGYSLTFNGDGTASYDDYHEQFSGNTQTGGSTAAATAWSASGLLIGNNATAGQVSAMMLVLPGYDDTNWWKSGWLLLNTWGQRWAQLSLGYRSTNAIAQITLDSTAHLLTNSRMVVYGTE